MSENPIAGVTRQIDIRAAVQQVRELVDEGNQGRLTVIVYELYCMLSELTNYNCRSLDAFGIAAEAIPNAHVDYGTLDMAEKELAAVRTELGLRE